MKQSTKFALVYHAKNIGAFLGLVVFALSSSFLVFALNAWLNGNL